MDLDKGRFSNIYVIPKYFLTHCGQGVCSVAWEGWDAVQMVSVGTLMEGKGPGLGCVHPHPSPAWGAFTPFSGRMDLVCVLSLFRTT